MVGAMHEAAGRSPETAGDVTPAAPTPAADAERILLLECRLEQLRSALDEARADADGVRVKLAEAAAREADHARRYGLIHQELADARAEIVSLHERLDRSEALRAELEGHLFEAGARGDAAELVRLRREVLAQRQRSSINERTCARLRARVDELLLSRETLLTRVAEWQRLIQKEGPAAADLAEFMAELRGDILHLEHRNATGERQAAALRERLVRAGLDPDGRDAEDVPAALFEAALDDDATPEFLPLEGDVIDTAGPVNEEPLTPQSTVAPEAASPGATIPETATPKATTSAAGRAVAVPEAAASTAEKPRPEKRHATAPDAAKTGAAMPVAERAEVQGSADDKRRATDSAEARPATEPQTASRAGAGVEAAPTVRRTDAEPRARESNEPTGDATAPPALTPRDVHPAGAPAPTPRDVRRAGAPVEGLDAPDPSARAAAYERLTRVLEGDPTRLADYLRPGLADPHPRVRRRAVLAAATAQRLPLQPLLEPLQADPDPHVRRVVREVLRHVSRAQLRTDDEDDVVLTSARAGSETRS